ncbi:hypothetical protein ACTG22_01160 [Aeromonas caviae]|uniref:hypothetical protein n=1 Tax=Aeromonas caviae TaxID=648 RepID=UPI0030B118F0
MKVRELHRLLADLPLGIFRDLYLPAIEADRVWVSVVVADRLLAVVRSKEARQLRLRVRREAIRPF